MNTLFALRHRASLIALLFMISVLASCGSPQLLVTRDNLEQQETILASTSVENYNMTVSELYHELEQSLMLMQGGIIEGEPLRVFVDSLLVDTLLGLKCKQVNLRDQPAFYQTYRLRRLNELMRAYFSEAIGPEDVDSQAIVDFYNRNPEKFTYPEQVLVHTILISPLHLINGEDSLIYRPLSGEERMQKAYEYAIEVRNKIKSPGDFPEVARKYSHAADADVKGGLLGWAMRGTYLPPFDSVVFSLGMEEISMPYRDRDGWHIMMVSDKLPGGLQPLVGDFYEQAWRYAQNERVNVVGKELVDSLLESLTVEYNDSVMTMDMRLCDPYAWVATINGVDTIIVSDLKNYEEQYRSKTGEAFSPPDVRKQMLKGLLAQFGAASAAISMKLDTMPKLREALEFLEHVAQKNYLRSSILPPRFEPTRAEIDEYYAKHKNEFYSDKPAVVQHIIATDSVEAEFIRDQARSGVDFMQLAKEYYPGDPRVRTELADLGAIGEQDVSPEFWKRVLLTPAGQVGDLLRTDKGYEIIKVLSKFDNRDLKSASPYIASTLKLQFDARYGEKIKQDLFTEFGLKYRGTLPRIQLRPREERLVQTNGG